MVRNVIVAIGAAIYIFAMVFVYSLCKAAATSDKFE